MDNICAGCLCSERKLVFLYDTGYFNLYSQIINEISAYILDFQTIKICWECKALLKKVDVFKEQVKGSHAVLLNCVQQNDTSKLQTKPSHLHIHSQYNIDIVEVKIENDVFDDDDDDKLAVSPVETSVKLEYPNIEHHLEPESFVKDLYLEPVKNKKELKKKITKPIKEKVKSKLKVKEKPEKKKIKAKKKISKSTKKLNDYVINDDRDDDDDVSHFCDDDDDQKIHLEETEVKDVITQSDVKELDVPTTNGVISNGDPSTELPERPRCVECGKNFSSKKTYRYHLNVLHKGQNRYPCPRCGKVYQWKSNLGRHMRSHKARDSGELYCETCDKRFASVATYRQHLRVSRRHVSESEFSFMCNECGKKFVNKTRLRDHIDWEHLKKIKFKCQLCNKPFKCHTSLYVHMQNVHRNKEKKTNLCHVCGKSYQNAAKLKYHIVAMHTSETPYQCSQCNAAFGWYSSLYRHVREVHYKMKLHQKKTKKGKKIDVSSIMGQPVILPQIHQPGPP